MRDNLFTIPDDIVPVIDCPPTAGKLFVWTFEQTQPSTKTRVSVAKNLFSFLLEGEKVVHLPGDIIRISAGEFMLIAGGNCLMSERLSTTGRYRAILFYFDDSLLEDFYLKYPLLAVQHGSGKAPVVVFRTDAFIGNLLGSLELTLQQPPALQSALQQLKLEELLLYLAERYPQQLRAIRRARAGDSGDEQIRAAVEGNLNHAISVEELAFLCNMSLSTFSRRFVRLYGTTPNKWLLQRRMEHAATLLNGREKPSEVYLKVGYENHSSFTQSFKQVYGVTPSEYQRRKSPLGAHD
jgi:AraC family transcriptional regulator, exoenzyme S synthesis regulatory protein ExsA